MPRRVVRRRGDDPVARALRDPARALRNVNRLLRPGGWFVCEVPNAECLGFQRSGPAWFHCDAGRHISYFTAKSLTVALESAGFSVTAVHYAGYTRQFTWLEAEQEVWDRLYSDPPKVGKGMTPRPSRERLWALAALTMLAPAWRKYDSVRIHARKSRKAGSET